MKTLILTSWYPNEKNIVTGIFVKDQAIALYKNGVDIVVFYPYDKSKIKNHMDLAYEDGIKVYRANTDYLKNSKLSRINSIIKSFKFLRKIILKEKINIIHAHVCYSAGFVAYFYKLIYRMPYIITEHMSTIYQYAEKRYNRILFKLAYSNAQTVICVSSYLKDELFNLGFKFNPLVIGNMVDTDKFIFEKIQRDKHAFNILFIGGMDNSEVKGLQYFLPALSEFIKEISDKGIKVSFTAIGDGNKRKDYENLCCNLGISKMCSFIGNITKIEITKYMKMNDILVLPSIKETFGCVLIEGMASGLPILSTYSGGPEEIVNSDVGLLVDSKSKDALKRGLFDIISRYESFDRQKIRDYAISNYSSNVVADKIKEVYKNNLSDGEI